MNLIIVAVLALVSTFLGGLFAVKIRDRLHLVLGFSAGALLSVAFFDLLPESLELTAQTYEIATVSGFIALGFLIFMCLDRFIAPHTHSHEDHHECDNPHHRGIVGAGSLSLHSLLDGIAIGLAYQVSPAVFSVVTAAVLVHDFSDGINTVSLIMKNGGTVKKAFRWLAIDAIAPVVGILLSLFITIDQPTLGIVLALFCGFFLYIGASDLLPESHHRHPTLWTTFSTLVGAAVLFGVIHIFAA